MKKFFNLSLILVFAVSLWGCIDNSTGSDSNVDEAPAERQFVWNALNYWYYWQSDVPELADNQEFFENKQAWHDYLKSFEDPESLFYELVYEQEDDFSFFIDNYEDFLNAQLGNSKSFGFEFGLVRISSNSNDIFGYVQYVLPGTPADAAGLERGDIFTGINGTTLTVNNYLSVLSADSYDLSIAERVDGAYKETGEVISVPSTDIQEDPVFTAKVIETGGIKVGYLIYNAFHLNSHERLDQVFGDFKAQGIDELIVDLRYNGGGAVLTSTILASMISGLGSSNNYAQYTFNSKRSNYNQNVAFLDQVPVYDDNGDFVANIAMNKLSVDRVFFLTGFGTASASEALINGIKPFMDVILVGRTTVGKDEGSLTLFDSGPDFRDINNASPLHKMAIQPIVLKIVNSLDEDYPDGFDPDYPVNELQYLETLPPFGNESDPVVARALEVITGEPMAKAAPISPEFQGVPFRDSHDLQPGNGMYLLPEQVKNLNLVPDVSKE